MARFDRTRYDYRGPEFDRRYGRFEHAFARRSALQRWEVERDLRHGRRPRERLRERPGDFRYEEFEYEDRGYSRRHWPRAVRPYRRMY